MPETTLTTPTLDTYLDEANPAISRGADATVTWGWAGNSNYDAMLIFDLSAIAKGSKIQEAILSIYVTGDIGAGVDSTTIWRVLSGNSSWVEAADWNTVDGAAAAWAGTAGCETEGIDIAAGKLWGPTNVALAGLPKWVDFSLAPSEFQALIDVGNYGIKLGSTVRLSGVNRSGVFTSKDGGAEKPKLFVRWIEPSGRLFEYKFNKYDPSPVLLGPMGEEIALNEVRADKWVFTEGFDLPGGIAYESLIIDPRMGYIVGCTYDEDGNRLGMEMDRNQFADAIIKRLVEGA